MEVVSEALLSQNCTADLAYVRAQEVNGRVSLGAMAYAPAV